MRNMNFLIKIVITIGLAITVIGFIWFLFIMPITGVFYGYSDGQRTGDIYKFSKKGIIWKSWEGEMYLGGLVSSGQGNLEMEKFYFSIPETEEIEKMELIEKIKKCAQERLRCNIVYKQWFISPIKIGSSYVVLDVKIEK